MLRQLSAVAASAAFITLLGSGCSTPQPIVRNYLAAEPTRDAKLGNAKLKLFLDEKLGDENIPCSMLYVELPHDETMALRRLESAETILVQSGSGILTVNGRKIPVGPGSAVFIPAGATQKLFNNSSETMKYISVIVPPFRDDECEFIDHD